jgi:acetyl esterase/lipase
MIIKETVNIWDGSPPGALGNSEVDIPTLTPYLPENPALDNMGILILPGGGYGGLAEHEGKGYAEWFAELGIASFVLKYRLGSAGYRHPVMLNDAARAMRFIKANAFDYKVNPEKIGVIGSSAGGHLASTLLTKFDYGNPNSSELIEQQSSKPFFGILCYPVITMGPEGHLGSMENLLGKDPDEELKDLLSSEKQVSPETPPCFIWHTVEDPGVPVANSMMFAAALDKCGVPFDLHLYEKGGHGLGLGDNHPWTVECKRWLLDR